MTLGSMDQMLCVNPKDMKISDSLYFDIINIITKFQLYRIDREGNVVKFVCVKIDKIFLNFKFFQKVKSC